MERLKAPLRVINTFALLVMAYAMLVNPSSAAPSSGPLAAPMGAGFEYEGRLNNVTGKYDFKFRLFNAATNGNVVIGTTAVATSVPVVNGEYRTVLRFGEGIMSVLTGEAVYVDVAYRVATTNANAPYMLLPQPRAQLMPQAYAMSLRPGATVRGNLSGAGLFVNNTGNGTGVAGQSKGGSGVTGQSTSWIGVYGVSQTQSGVWGNSTSGAGVHGSSATNSGVWGKSTSGAGVHGVSSTNAAVWGLSTSGAGVWGQSSSWIGVHGESQTQTGTLGKSTTATGVWGESRDHYGVFGTSVSSDGVHGVTGATNFSGVVGIHTANGFGVYGRSTNRAGVYGTASNGHGVEGVVGNQYMAGVRATNTAGGNALSVSGNAAQSLSGGGLVKAMALIDPYDGTDPVKQCFNSQLPGTQTTSGNCGITMTSTVPSCRGSKVVDFGFRVDDRFAVVTPITNYSAGVTAELYSYHHEPSNAPNQVAVRTFYAETDETTCARFMILIY